VKLSELYRENSENCEQLSQAADTERDRKRYGRMAVSWLALAAEQEWLDGDRPPESE
jgi:hypothetical protein